MTSSNVWTTSRPRSPHVVAVAAALLGGLLAITYSAFATPLDVQDRSGFAAGSGLLVMGCDLDVTTELGRVWSSSESLWTVTSVTVSEIRADCAGQTMTVSLSDVRGQELLTGSTELASGGAGTVDFVASVDLDSVAAVTVVIQKSHEVSVS